MAQPGDKTALSNRLDTQQGREALAQWEGRLTPEGGDMPIAMDGAGVLTQSA